MAGTDRNGAAETVRSQPVPTSLGGKLKVVGPGLVIAATGVGAGDMVTSLEAGTRYGITLIWAIILGAAIKLALVEGMGRWYMATGRTIIEGWHSLSPLASGYFVVYLFIVMFFYGAAITSASALATDAMFPDVMPVWAWAVLHGVAGFTILVIGRYGVFERIMEVFVGLMFVTIVGLGAFLLPGLEQNLAASVVPTIPEGSLLYTLSVIGGLSGTYSLAAYTYWVRERGWRRSAWIPVMRVDAGVGYILTALFMIAMLIVGASFLFGSGTSIGDGEGLVTVSGPLGDRFGPVVPWLFLIGFWSATTSSILGGWNAGAYLFADYVRTVKRIPEERAEGYLSERSPWFRGFLVWAAFPPMLLFTLDEPVLMVIIYAALGALFLPFMAVTLLWLLNRRVEGAYRNRVLANLVMAAGVLLFLVLAVTEIADLF